MAIVDMNALFAAQNSEDNNSKKGMLYTGDDGTTYIVSITENIGEALGFDDVQVATPTTPALPRGYRMRKITFSDSSGRVGGSYFIGKPNTPIYAEGGTITVPRKGKALGLVCQVTGTQGERKTFFGANDTGQQSGDIT